VILVPATYLKGGYVIREPEVGMTCRLRVVGLEDEVSNHVYVERITYRTGIIEHYGVEHHRVVVEAWLWTRRLQSKGASEGTRRSDHERQSTMATWEAARTTNSETQRLYTHL
jgi:hypothetical protein